MNNINWFEQLFPPAYSFYTEDLSYEANKSDQTFRKYVNQCVKDLDVDSIKNVYHRVYIIIKALNNVESNENNSQVQFADSSSQTDSVECIWTNEELGLLRRTSDSIKSENFSLKLQINDLRKECSDRKDQNINLEKSVLNYKNELQEALKSNQRLSILCENLKDTLNATEIEKSAGEKLFKKISTNHEILITNFRNSKIIITALEHEITNLKIAHSVREGQLKYEHERKLKEHVDDRDNKLNNLNSVCETIRLELFDKNKELDKVNEAFRSIKLHFGSKANVSCDEDILKNINYYSGC